MTQMWRIVGSVILLWLSMWAHPALAQTQVLLRDAAVGGMTVTAGDYRLSATVGDGIVSGPVSAGDFRLEGGFMIRSLPQQQALYLPAIHR